MELQSRRAGLRWTFEPRLTPDPLADHNGPNGSIRTAQLEEPRLARQISPALQRMRWFAVVLCMIAIALNYIDRSTLAVGNLQIRESFALTAAGIGALQSAWSLTYAFAQLPIGALIDRIG